MSSEIDFGRENRRRLSGPGLRSFLACAIQWGLTEAEQVQMVGVRPVPAYREWIAQARAQQDLILDVDVLMRISAVLSIYGSLASLYSTEEERLGWLRGPHHSIVFRGRAPMDLVREGTLDGLMMVRRFLAAACEGLYMEPNEIDRDFQPYIDQDIVFTDNSSNKLG